MPTLKRARQHASVFGALLGVVAIVTALSVGLIGYLGAAATAGVRTELSSVPGGEVQLRMTLVPSPDEGGQDSAVRDLLARVFRGDDGAIPIDVDRIVRSDGSISVGRTPSTVAASLRSAAVVSIGAGSTDGSIEHVAVLVDGEWPASDAGLAASVQADTAAALGVGVGSVLSLGDADVTVTGTWRLRDDYRGALAADPLFSAASGADTPGPIVIDESTWAAIARDRLVQWTITPQVAQLHRGDLQTIVAGWGALPAIARADSALDSTGLDRSGRLVTTAIRVGGRVDALGVIAPVALLILAAIALVTVIELARLLARVRAGETALQYARGSSIVRIAGSAVGEATVVAAVGVLLGLGVASAVLSAVGTALGVGSGATVRGAGLVLWAAPLLVMVVVAAAVGVVVTRSVLVDPREEQSGRLSRAGLSGAVVLVAAAAALATWQLRVYGSPVVPARDGGSRIDLVAVLAPAALLMAVALVGFVVFALLARPVDRRAAASVRLSGATVVRNIARRLPQAATPFLLVAFACGQLVFAAGYASTWERAFTVAAELRAGTSVHISGLGRDLSTAVLDAAASVDGIDAVAPVISRDVVIGSEQTSLVAIAPTALRQLAPPLSGILDPDVAAAAITAESIDPVIPTGTGEVTLTITTDGFAATPAVDLVLANADGRLTRVAAIPADTDAATATNDGTRLVLDPGSAGTGPWTVAAAEIDIPAAASTGVPEVNPPSFALTGLTADGTGVELGDSWYPVDITPGSIPVPTYDQFPAPDPAGPRFDVTAGVLRMRLVPSLVQGGDRVQPPVVVSQELANRSGITPGEVIPVNVDARWETVFCEVAAVLPAVPGARSDRAVLMDGGVVQSILLRSYSDEVAPEQAWLGTATGTGSGTDGDGGIGSDTGSDTVRESSAADAAITVELRRVLPARVAVESLALDPSRDILGSSRIALWIGAIGTALLALFTLIAATRSQLASRREEVLVLRALGVSARRTARLRGLELVVVIVSGLAVGGIAGIAVTLLTAAEVARSALPDLYASLPTGVRLDAALLVPAIAGFAVLAAAIVIVAARTVGRQARSAAASAEER